MLIDTNISKFDYDIDQIFTSEDMSNKLFCTFSTESNLPVILDSIQEKYKILYNKIFILYASSQDEYM